MIRKLWSDMYARLLPEMVTEYRGLVSLTNPKTSEFQSEGEWHRVTLRSYTQMGHHRQIQSG
ncbi:hypothetical protein YC2023_036700 [Brassica napus]